MSAEEEVTTEEKRGLLTRLGFVGELVLIVAVSLGLVFLIQFLLVKPYQIPSASMVPTLVEGQRVIVSRISSRLGSPKVGQVTVFHPPARAGERGGFEQCGDPNIVPGQPCDRPVGQPSEQNFIKRIVAGPGDTLAIRGGRVVLNGRVQNEPFITPCERGDDCNFERTIKVPAGHWFMMGDNRGKSDDSRYWGPVPEDWIIGPAFLTYWPPNRIGGV